MESLFLLLLSPPLEFVPRRKLLVSLVTEAMDGVNSDDGTGNRRALDED